MRQMQLEPFFLGFDDAFNQLMGLKNDLNKHISNYPPYNIKKVDDNEFELEFAVAGFSKEHVEVESAEVENGLLKVRLKKYLPKHLQPKEIVVK
jgi:molecular chaperone IbpA